MLVKYWLAPIRDLHIQHRLEFKAGELILIKPGQTTRVDVKAVIVASTQLKIFVLRLTRGWHGAIAHSRSIHIELAICRYLFYWTRVEASIYLIELLYLFRWFDIVMQRVRRWFRPLGRCVNVGWLRHVHSVVLMWSHRLSHCDVFLL